MTRHPRQSNVEQVERMLDDGLDIDEIAAALRLTEREVGRIAGLLAERGPADPAPDVDVAALAAVADEVLTVDDDEPAGFPNTGHPETDRHRAHEQVRAAALLARRATSQDDLQDLAGALGIRHAIDPAERWLNARARAAAAPSDAVENHATPLLERFPGGFVRPAPEPSMTDRLAEHVAAYALPTSAGSDETTAETTAKHDGCLACVLLDEDDVEEDDEPAEPDPFDYPEAKCLDCGSPVCDGFPNCKPDDADDEPEHTAPEPEPEHEHDPFVAYDEHGIAYAACSGCDTTWQRAVCDYPGCNAHVSGLFIARGHTRHPHHNLKTERTKTP